MRPVTGLVVDSDSSGLRVRMQSGRVVRVPHTLGLQTWEPVNVFWDFVKGCVASIERRNPNSELDETPSEPHSPDNLGEEPPAGIHEVEYLVTGALCPLGVESGDSGFWELVLSDGSLGAAGVM